MSSNLVGAFHIDKANLLSPDQKLHLVIGSRQKPTPTKPKYYLLQRLSPKEHIYISSLFEVPEWSVNAPQHYSFDWKGQEYTLTIDQAKKTTIIDQKTSPAGQAVS